MYPVIADTVIPYAVTTVYDRDNLYRSGVGRLVLLRGINRINSTKAPTLGCFLSAITLKTTHLPPKTDGFCQTCKYGLSELKKNTPGANPLKKFTHSFCKLDHLSSMGKTNSLITVLLEK